MGSGDRDADAQKISRVKAATVDGDTADYSMQFIAKNKGPDPMDSDDRLADAAQRIVDLSILNQFLYFSIYNPNIY